MFYNSKARTFWGNKESSSMAVGVTNDLLTSSILTSISCQSPLMDTLPRRSASFGEASCFVRSLCMFRWMSTAVPLVAVLFSSSSRCP